MLQQNHVRISKKGQTLLNNSALASKVLIVINLQQDLFCRGEKLKIMHGDDGVFVKRIKP